MTLTRMDAAHILILAAVVGFAIGATPPLVASLLDRVRQLRE